MTFNVVYMLSKFHYFFMKGTQNYLKMTSMGGSFRSGVTIVTAFGDFKVKSHVIEITIKSPKAGTKVQVS